MRLSVPASLVLIAASALALPGQEIRFAGQRVAVPVDQGADPAQVSLGHGVIVGSSINLRLKPGIDPATASTALGLGAGKPLPGGWWSFPARGVVSAQRAGESALALGFASTVEQGVSTLPHLRSVPNDPLFSLQWNMRDPTNGQDLDVSNAWNSTRGAGITVGVIDSGVSKLHPDLAPNLDLANSFDFITGVGGGQPLDDTDYHGTFCASLIAAKQNDNVGMSGVAPDARIASETLIVGVPILISQMAQAMSFGMDRTHFVGGICISSNSWGPQDDPVDDGPLVEDPPQSVADSISDGVTYARGGKGILYVWASGNGRAEGDNVDWDGYASNPNVIAVGSTTIYGQQAFYSEGGASLLVCAPAGGHTVTAAGTATSPATVSVDDAVLGATIVGGSVTSPGTISGSVATYDFGTGTSFAAPLVSGTAALMLSVNPWMTWRDLRWVLAATAAQTDASNAGWIVNGAGFAWNPAYGFGRVDATAAMKAASAFKGLPLRTAPITAGVEPVAPIPDGVVAGGPSVRVAITLPAPGDFRLESLLLRENATHPRQGDLEFTVISPAGTRIQVQGRGSDTAAARAHIFHLTGFMGEAAGGTWYVEVRDRAVGMTGSIDVLELTAIGFKGINPTVDPTGGGVVIPDGGVAVTIGGTLGTGTGVDGTGAPSPLLEGGADKGGGCGSGGGLAVSLGGLALICLRRRRR